MSAFNDNTMAVKSGMVSVLVVIDNDLAILESFIVEMGSSLQKCYQHYELVIVDNGSSDGSAKFILDRLGIWPNIHFLRLSTPTSTEVAITAGLEHCIGDYAVLVDPYLDSATEVVRLLDVAADGYDVVIADRSGVPRAGMLHRLAYRAAGRILGEELQSDASYFRVLSRNVIAALTRIRSPRRSLKYFNALVGYKQTTVRTTSETGCPRPRRKRGSSIWRAIDLVISNSFVPLRFASGLGLLASTCSAAYLGYAFLVTALKSHVAEGWFTTSVLMSTMFFFLFLILSVLAEYVIRVLEESQNRPLYFVEMESSSLVNISNQRNIVNVV